ncbi:uncharacterized protein DUF1194 [Roseibium hamelinense]|uniref:Uncharacterized protein DUF1194 n=1 Tax=Roseibium hamelinense TaxID=150831 RepID=A0A562SHZ2_9HYPH|nr:DUF1194 domain-containing protein [Roseibium hamelinense]MTI43947.1 DUF1194 domain-containing protein [Roseibium hamelinense]TWI80758.1 uncharacterized protein DUF1194 [Roseibium hamelinense]
MRLDRILQAAADIPRVTLVSASISVALLGASFAPATADTHQRNIITGYAYDPANEVDVELVLAVDISQSMDTEEQEVQRAGYVAALTSPEFLEAVKYGPIGRVAIAYMEWGGVDEHFMVADWTVIQDEQTAEGFAAQIAEAPLRQVQRTSIASALAKSVSLVKTNQYTGLRQVIDISGDGPNNQGGSVTKVRDQLIAAGVTINGLPLMMKSSSNTWQAMLNLDHYYEDCVIGGPGSFAIPVKSKEGFADAIRMKLVMEIAGLTFEKPLVRTVADRQPIRCNVFD